MKEMVLEAGKFLAGLVFLVALYVGLPTLVLVWLLWMMVGVSKTYEIHQRDQVNRGAAFTKQCRADGKSQTDCAVLWEQVR